MNMSGVLEKRMIDLEQRYRRMMKMNLQKINYQKELEKLLTRLEKEEKVPTLLLHSCCAPCSSYVLEYLSQYF